MRHYVGKAIGGDIAAQYLVHQALRLGRQHPAIRADALRHRHRKRTDIGAGVDGDVAGLDQPQQQLQLELGIFAVQLQAAADETIARVVEERAVPAALGAVGQRAGRRRWLGAGGGVAGAGAPNDVSSGVSPTSCSTPILRPSKSCSAQL